MLETAFLELYKMIKDYTREFTITNNYLDTYDNLKPSAILDLSQEIAGSHAKLLDVGFNEFIARGLIWVIVRNKVEIVKNIRQLENVKIRSMLTKARLIELPRDYEFYANNELFIKERSVWMIFDLNTKKVVLPNEFETLKTDYEGIFPRVKKLTELKKEELEFNKDFIVPFSYLDHNGHMNNTHYLDLFLDVYKPKKEEVLKSFQVEYISQCYLDEKISLYTLVKNNTKYLYGYNGEELKFYLEANY